MPLPTAINASPTDRPRTRWNDSRSPKRKTSFPYSDMSDGEVVAWNTSKNVSDCDANDCIVARNARSLWESKETTKTDKRVLRASASDDLGGGYDSNFSMYSS